MLFFNILLEILDISTRYRAVKYTKTQNIPQISTFYLSCYVIFKKPTTRSRRGGITSCHRSALQLSCHFHVPNIIYDFPPQPSTVNSINLWVGGGGVWFIGLWARVSTSSFVSQIFAASSLDDGIILFFTIAERAQTHTHRKKPTTIRDLWIYRRHPRTDLLDTSLFSCLNSFFRSFCVWVAIM